MSSKFIEFDNKAVRKTSILFISKSESPTKPNIGCFHLNIWITSDFYLCETYSFEKDRGKRFDEIMKLLEE